MKLKAAISNGAPSALVDAFASSEFAARFLDEVVGMVFGVADPQDHPAAYYVQMPDTTIQVGNVIGVEVRLTGVSRNGRSAKIFHEALRALKDLVETTTKEVLPSTDTAQVFVVLMLDGDVETAPGSGIYSPVLETEPTWVKGQGS